jgi:hypothetical protein
MTYNEDTVKDMVRRARWFDWDDEDAATVEKSEDIFQALVSDDAWKLRHVDSEGHLEGFNYAVASTACTSVSTFMQDFISRRERIEVLKENSNMAFMLFETKHEILSVYRRVRTARAWAYAFPDSNDEDASTTVSIHIAVCHLIPWETMEVLLEAGARVESRDGKGNTPLMLLAYECDDNTKSKISLLLDYNSKVEATNQNLDTAVHIAAQFSDITVLGLLLMGVDCRVSPFPVIWYNADFMLPTMLALENRNHRHQSRDMVDKLIQAGGKANSQMKYGNFVTGKICCFELFDIATLTVIDSCCVTLLRGNGISVKICMPIRDIVSHIDKSVSKMPTAAMDFLHFLHSVDGQLFKNKVDEGSVTGLYDFSIRATYPPSLGFGTDPYTVVFRFPGDVLPEGTTKVVVRDPRRTLGHAIVDAIGYGATEFHSLFPLLRKYCNPLMKCADGKTAADTFTLQMHDRKNSDARPSRGMNKRLREMQDDVAEMNTYIHAPPPKKGPPVSRLSCLPDDVLRGVMRVMVGGSMDEKAFVLKRSCE